MFYYSQPHFRPTTFAAPAVQPDYASVLGALLGNNVQPVQQSPIDVLLGRNQNQQQFLAQQLLQAKQDQVVLQALLQQAEQQAALDALAQQNQVNNLLLSALAQQQQPQQNLLAAVQHTAQPQPQAQAQLADLLAALQPRAQPQPQQPVTDLTSLLHSLVAAQSQSQPRAQIPVPAVPAAGNDVQAVLQSFLRQQVQPSQAQAPVASNLVRRPHIRQAPVQAAQAPVRKCCGPAPTEKDLLKVIFNAVQPSQKPKLTLEPKPVPVPAPRAPKAVPTKKEDPEADLQAFFQHVFGPSAQVNVVPKPTAPKPSTSKASGLSLKEQLEARLYSDESTEIQDTIRAIMASLHDGPAAQYVSAPAKPAASSSSDKGKAKAAPKDTAPVDASPKSTEINVGESLAIIRSIDDAFKVLSDEFVFPSQLDFSAPASPTVTAFDGTQQPSTAKLAYTAPNHPLKLYEQSLTSLLLQLDNVDSYGDETVRHERKEVVGRVEKALEDLEGEVDGRRRSWERKQQKQEEVLVRSQPEQEPLEESQVTIKPSDLKEPEGSKAQEVETQNAQPPAYDVDASIIVEEPHAQQLDTEAEVPEIHAHPADVEVAEPSDDSESDLSESEAEHIDEPEVAEVVQEVESEAIDTFLQPAVVEQTEKKIPNHQNDDSDWSELEA